MEKTITRVFSFDGDSCEVVFYYDDTFNQYFGAYPDFEETPKYTLNGWMWTTAMQDACIYGRTEKQIECLDCGSCEHFRREETGDLIGVCEHELKRRKI